MKILVTGAAGFIGSHLFDCLIKDGHQVLGIDNYSIGNYKHTDIKKLDLLTDKIKVAKLISRFKPKLIYHLAAWAHEGLSNFSPIRIIENNIDAYLGVLIPAINNKVNKIILVSSLSVYGNQKAPFNEKMLKKPVDIYGVSKAAMEEITEILSKVHRFEYVIVRLHNVYGPRQNLADPYRNVVGIFINCLLRNKPFYIYGDGRQKRAFSYIDDILPSLVKTGFKKISGEIFNLGSTTTYSINDLSATVRRHFPSAPEPIYLPTRPQEVDNVYSNNRKAKKILGFTDKTTLEEGIKKMITWAKKTGPQRPRYLKEIEIKSIKTPKTWMRKLI